MSRVGIVWKHVQHQFEYRHFGIKKQGEKSTKLSGAFFLYPPCSHPCRRTILPSMLIHLYHIPNNRQCRQQLSKRQLFQQWLHLWTKVSDNQLSQLVFCHSLKYFVKVVAVASTSPVVHTFAETNKNFFGVSAFRASILSQVPSNRFLWMPTTVFTALELMSVISLPPLWRSPWSHVYTVFKECLPYRRLRDEVQEWCQ